MNTFLRLVGYHLRDMARSRWLLIYAAGFAVATDALLRFSDSPLKAGLALTSVVLLVVPLVTLMMGTMYVYAAREFTEVLLAQPIRRRVLFLAQFAGMALPVSAAFAAGLLLPFAVHGALAGGSDGGGAAGLLSLLAAGIGLTWIFTALAQLIAVTCEDRVRGLGLAVGAWLALAILYDGVVLVLATMLGEYPIERPMLVLMLLNPVDLARLALLLQFDAAALVGVTGAVFRSLFEGVTGLLIVLAALLAWVAGPTLLGARRFERKDF